MLPAAGHRGETFLPGRQERNLEPMQPPSQVQPESVRVRGRGVRTHLLQLVQQVLCHLLLLKELHGPLLRPQLYGQSDRPPWHVRSR